MAKATPKGTDDFSKPQAEKIRDELASATTGIQREAIYKKHGTSKQKFIQVIKANGLPSLPVSKSSSKNRIKAPLKAAKPNHKPTSLPAAKHQAARPNAALKKSSLSLESKELLIKMMSKLLED